MTRIERTFHLIFNNDTPAQRRRLILELDREEPTPFVTQRLTEQQVAALAEYIVLLPWPHFRLLTLHHSFHLPPNRLSAITGEPHCRGVLRYCKDRLAQCLGVCRPPAPWSWFLACNRALDMYFFHPPK